MNELIIICAKYLILIPIIVFVLFWFKANKLTKKKVFLLSIITLPVSYILAKVGGHLYMDPRPFVQNNFVPLINHARDNGFPSDHTLLSAALGSVLYAFNKRLGLGLLIITFIIGLSRVLAGVHHIVDIVVSILIAIVVTYVAHTVLLKYSYLYKNHD